EPARAQRLLPGVPGRQNALAAQAALGVVQQPPGPIRIAARPPDRGCDGHPRLTVLRGGRYGPLAPGGTAVIELPPAAEPGRAQGGRRFAPRTRTPGD